MAAEKNVVAGAFLGFKVGTQANIDTMLAAGANAGAQHGCFYLTKDSHRLYIGNEDTSLSPVNEGIETLTWSELETLAAGLSSLDAKKAATGRFYYASDQNILCVYNGTQFVQLNENTNTFVDTHSMAVSASGDTATVTDSLIMNTGGHKDASFTVTGANGITISGTGSALTLSGDTYTLSSADVTSTGTGAKIKLDSTNTNNDSEVTFTAGNNVTITGSASGITIESANAKLSSLAITELGSSTSPTVGFKVEVSDTSGVTKSDTVDPVISWYTDPDASVTTTNSAHFSSGVATLDVYSRAAVDSKLQAINAMTYRGTVGSTGSAATSITYDSANDVAVIMNGSTAVPVSIGDTFLMLTDGTYNGQDYKAGSLLIVRAKNNAQEVNGVLPASGVAVDVVAEQWNSDTTYEFLPITGGVALRGSTGSNKGSLVVDSGDAYIGVAEATTGSGSNLTKTLTLTHENVSRSDGTGEAVTQANVGSVTIPVITGVTSDAKGHVTGITTTNYTVVDTNSTLSSLTSTTTASNDNTTGTIAVTAGMTKGNGNTSNTQTTSFTVSSTSLKIEDADAAGGTPAGLAINMVWGSF